ncbi:MAG: GGDEF domain-containing protein [Fimbriimonadaceae bacterium]
MAWFKRKTSNPFEKLSAEQLAELIDVYKSLSECAMFGKIPLLISPGSAESIRFLQDIAKLSDKLDRHCENAETVEVVSKTLQAEVDRFGAWQQTQAQYMIDEFTDSLMQISHCCSGSLDQQDHMVQSLQGIEKRLDQVRESNDLTKIREALRGEVDRTRRVLAEQIKSRQALREHFSSKVKEMEDRIAKAEKSAQTDHLTNLGNRAAFEFFGEAILQRVRYGDGPYCVTMFDLDNFKKINDTHGHAAGDAVLNHFAGFLKKAFPRPAFVGRFGGDEFVVVCAGGIDAVRLRIANVLQELNRRPMEITLEGKPTQLKVGASGGSTELSPDELLSECLARADLALYDAKRRGKGQAAAA